MSSEYTHVILNLIIILTLMVSVVFFIKKFKLTKYGANKHVNIINVVPIGAKEKIILLEVNNLTLLIGATPNHIATLHVFNDKKSAALAAEVSFDDEIQKLQTNE